MERRTVASRLVGTLVSWLVIGGLNGGCSPDEETSSQAEDARLRARLAELEGALAAEAADPARALGSLRRAEELRDEARRLLEDVGPTEAVRRRLEAARSALERARRETLELKRLAARATRLEKEAREARARAADGSAAGTAEFVEADRLLASGARQRVGGDAGALVAAAQDLERAAELYRAAEEVAGGTRRSRASIAAELRALERLREEASSVGVPEKFPADWLRAEQLERDARRHVETESWEDALGALRSAQNAIAAAIQTAVRIADAPAPVQVGTDSGDTTEPATTRPTPDDDDRSVRPPPPPPPRPARPDRLLRLAEEAAAYSSLQRLAPEDERFLAENLHALSEVLSYEPASGAIVLDYTNGRDLERDAITGSIPRAHLRFDDPVARAGSDEPLFSFEANTGGSFLVPVPFRYLVRATWSTQVHTMDQNGTFGALICIDTTDKTGFVAEGVHLGVTLRGDPPRWLRRVTAPPFHRNLNDWFEKKRPIVQSVEYVAHADSTGAPSEDARRRRPTRVRGVLATTYDLAGESELSTKVEVSRIHRGLVGFTWNRARFQARELVIEGVLDKERAVEILRALLGAERDATNRQLDAPRSLTGGSRYFTRLEQAIVSDPVDS